MVFRRLLAPAVWLTATVTAAALVSGAVRLALRSVSPPALAARPSDSHQRDAARGDAAAAGSAPTPPAAAGELGSGQDPLPVGDGATEETGRRGGSEAGGSATASRPSAPAGTAAVMPPGAPASSSSGAPPASTSGPWPGGDSGEPATSDPTNRRHSGAPSSSTTTTSTTAPPSGSTSSSTSTTSSTTTSTPEHDYVYKLDGGTVGVRCSGDTVSLTFASPNDGWSTAVVQSGPEVLDVRFQRGRSVSELQVMCSDGRADPHIDERSG